MRAEAQPPLLADEDADGCCPDVVEEASEIHAIIKRVVDSEGRNAEDEAVQDRWKAILYKYQEQSQLLDAFLEDIVLPLSTLLRSHATAQGASSASDATAPLPALPQIMGICRLLNVLVVVRGYKTVVKFFPHEAQDLERALSVLLAVRAAAKGVKTAEEGVAVWESQAILLLWLSMLILVPFDLATIDSTAVDMQGARAQPYTQLVSKLLTLCQEYLHQPGSVREMGALLLGRLLTRPDMGAALGDFVQWTDGALTRASPLAQPFLVPGILHSFSFAFKLGQRARLLPYTPKVWALLLGPLISGNPEVSGSVLARKLGIKLLQRLALTFLEPRQAPWRYRRQGGQELGAGLAGAADAGAVAASAATVQEEAADEEYEIAEEIEEVVERLLGALRDKDTIVRWSAAKGVGRVTGCLPQELADEVVAQVMELFRPTESDAAWHGGCLALAELARRGLLLPTRLPEVTSIVQRSLAYDVRRGPHSIGAHVRDAAAYVCWACARAYEPDVLEGSVHALASSLLVVACYDREVNCRRACAAAFQEAVGRLGNFPHGMDIIGVADYFAVGNVSQAYLRVAPFVGSFAEYRPALAEHLVDIKLAHWEKQLRELAARGCAALVPCYGNFFATSAMDLLLPRCLDTILEVRHGALMGVAELLPALQEAGLQLSQERILQVAGLVPAIDKARLYRGKGGEVMREAVGRLIAATARVQLPLSRSQHAKVLEALDENLRHPQLYIQAAAVEALRHYTRTYATAGEDAALFRDKQLRGYMTRLHDPNVAVRRGFASGLGALPVELLGPVAEEVLECLIDGMQPEEEVDERDVEARVNCTRALGAVCLTLMAPPEASSGSGDGGAAAVAPAQALELLQSKVLPCLHAALHDYTIDNRGDVGSLVREAAMEVLARLVQLMAELQPLQGGDEARLRGAVSRAVASVLKQAVERITRVRDAALLHLHALLAAPRVRQLIPAADRLAALLPKAEGIELAGAAPLDAVTQLARLLPVPAYTEQLLEGLVASVGGVDASLAKAASAALVDVLTSPSTDGAGTEAVPSGRTSDQAEAALAGEVLLQAVAVSLLEVWGRHAKSARLAGPLLRCADLLVSKTDILEVSVPAAAAAAAAAVAKPAAAAAAPAEAAAAAAAATAAVPLPDVLVELARGETRQCPDVPRLLDAATLLCHLVPYTNPCHASAVAGLLVLLVNRYPKVRRHAAEQMYLQLLTTELEQLVGAGADSGAGGVAPSVGPQQAACASSSGGEGTISGEDLEQAQELLLTTSWDGDLDNAKAARDTLSGLLRVPVPAMKAAAPSAAVGGTGAKAVRDENASYGALVMDFHRGFGM